MKTPIQTLVLTFAIFFAGYGGTAMLQSCNTTQPVEGQPTQAQLHAAARYSVTKSEQAAVVLHQGGVLSDSDFLAGATAIMAAREALSSIGLAGFDADTIAQALAAAKAAWLLAQAGYQVANAAKITPEQAAAWEVEGAAEDKAFDAYAASLSK